MKKLISILMLAIFFGGCAQIDESERGIVLSMGQYSETLKAGWHPIFPLTTEVIRYSTRVLLTDVQIAAGSKDLQSVGVSVRVNHHIDPDKVIDIYRKYGESYADSFLVPRIIETITGITPQYNAEEMLQKREEIRERMRQTLIEKVDSAKAPFFIDGFAIASFDFSREFMASVEAKQVQAQKAEMEKHITTQLEEKNTQKINEAKADSQAIGIRMKALTLNGSDAYLRLQFLEKWNGELPSVMSGDNKLMPMLNTGCK